MPKINKHNLERIALLDVMLVLSLMVAGCATSVLSANPRQVIVESQMMDAQKAQALADAECAKHKRYARMTLKADYWERNYTFECID